MKYLLFSFLHIFGLFKATRALIENFQIRPFNITAPVAATSTAPLTLDAITKHDARHSYATNGKATTDPTVNDIAMSLKSFNFDDENASESQFGTFKTFKTFASNYSACSNVSFNK